MSISGSTRLQSTLVLTLVIVSAVCGHDFLATSDQFISLLSKLDTSGLPDVANAEARIDRSGGRIAYHVDADQACITRMDTTERTAISNWDPFRNDLEDKSHQQSLCCLLVLGSTSSLDAQQKIFLRDLVSLDRNDRRTSPAYLLEFNFSVYDPSVYRNF